ncbi:thermonuclease family protein [Bacillus marinisedimentorum]|uniref:thermonuclease family protein n=1 Tax=Bacillus marinisedimentorum TaxID=1821260 RepID=UPI000A55C6DC|nr:thermonuclease family protein [Bacillus marinisedimentorum]
MNIFTAAKRYSTTGKMLFSAAALVLALLIAVTGCAGEGVSPETDGKIPPDNGDGSKEAQQEKPIPNSPEDSSSDNEAEKEVYDKQYIPASITRVVDGDTMKVELEDGRKETLRLLLVDTPESVHPDKPVQPFAQEASDYAKNTLTGKNVELKIDVSERDKYGRLLVYLHVDGYDFNKSLIQKGLARVAYVWAPNTSRADEYYEAQKIARQEGIGIWSIEDYAREDGFNDNAAVPGQSEEEASAGSGQVIAGTNTNEESDSSTNTNTGLRYDPDGPDRDCGDFSTQREAQAFYEAAGGPAADPHRLDGRDGDGIVCESLP